MKNVFLLLTVSLLFTLSCSNNKSILGKWEGKNYADQTLEFNFKKDGTAAMINGTEYTDVVYIIDKSKEPYHIDLSSKGEETLKAIYKFTEDGRLVLGMENDPSSRPVAFDGTVKRTLIFTRK